MPSVQRCVESDPPGRVRGLLGAWRVCQITIELVRSPTRSSRHCLLHSPHSIAASVSSLPSIPHAAIAPSGNPIGATPSDQALAQGRSAAQHAAMLSSGPLAARLAPAPLAQGGPGSMGPMGALPARQPSALARLRRARPGAACRPQRRCQTTAAALQREGESLALPLNYFKLLGVSGVCSRDTLARALEK